MISKEDILKRSRPVKSAYIIYALIHKGSIVYIGQSSSMLSRLQTHINSNKVFDSWAIVENLGEWASSEKLNSIELEYINMLKPKYNRQQIAKANKAKYRAKMKDKRKKAIACS